ncbi:MAG: ethanolamine utilization protein EutN [Puniceicoccaceae bacterium]|nr:MAG: ethanolamine utilization protein EutN [Puniceicoccaceae bacterium]
MRLARIHGHVVSTAKHASLEGWRLLIAQPISGDGTADGPPQIVIDCLGAGIQQTVLITSDGSEARKLVGSELSPARWSVCGLVDPERALAV